MTVTTADLVAALEPFEPIPGGNNVLAVHVDISVAQYRALATILTALKAGEVVLVDVREMDAVLMTALDCVQEHEPTAELEIECSYSVAWGSSESGSYGGPPEDYDPGSGDVVEDIKILTVDGKPWPVDITYGFLGELATYGLLADKLLDDHEEAMIEAAVEDEAARRDQAAEDRFERMREEMIEDDWS